MRRRLRWPSAVVLVVLSAALVAAGLVWHELDQGTSLFQSGGTWFRTGSDTSYGGPLRPGQTYAEEGPRFTNTTSRTVTLRDIALDHWCMWLGPGHCTPSSSVRVVKVLYMKGSGLTMTGGRSASDTRQWCLFFDPCPRRSRCRREPGSTQSTCGRLRDRVST